MNTGNTFINSDRAEILTVFTKHGKPQKLLHQDLNIKVNIYSVFDQTSHFDHWKRNQHCIRFSIVVLFFYIVLQTKSFTCFLLRTKMFTDFTLISSQCNLSVIEKEQVVAPKFVERFQQGQVNEGETLVLQVRAVGTPTPQLSWQKDGVSIMPSDNVQVRHTEGNKGRARSSMRVHFTFFS